MMRTGVLEARTIAVSVMACLVVACGGLREREEVPAADAGVPDADAALPSPTCEIVATDEERGTMTVRCDGPGPDSCDDAGQGVYTCELGCIRAPERDRDLCDPSRAFRCAAGYVPNDCRAFAEDLACCL